MSSDFDPPAFRFDLDEISQVGKNLNQPEILKNIEDAFMSGQLDHEHINSMQTKTLQNISSITFGGPDRKTIYLGNLQGHSIYALKSPVAGIEPAHWHVAV